jgi:cytochrome c oxidase cbb3-type subunit 3
VPTTSQRKSTDGKTVGGTSRSRDMLFGQLALRVAMATLLFRLPSQVLIGAALLAGTAFGQSPNALFLQQCSFCHGRDAGGGEDGPDLTRSKLVAGDHGGDQIAAVIRNGRVEHGMPRFNLTDQEIAGLVAFIHAQKTLAESQKGGRRGVDPADLQTGNADAGKRYFNGAGKCASCHSPSGDLAGIASRFEGLRLEERMLYPRGAKARVTVTPASGEKVTGELAYQDEFTVGMKDGAGHYRSWRASDVKYTVNDPAEAHVELLAKYTDGDIHDLMAYLQTLR